MRATIVAVLIVGGLLGWFLRSVRLQREAVEAIQRAGGWVAYDWPWADHGAYLGKITEPPWWAPIAQDVEPTLKVVGQDYAKWVVVMHMWGRYNVQAEDAVMVHVGRLTRLERLKQVLEKKQS